MSWAVALQGAQRVSGARRCERGAAVVLAAASLVVLLTIGAGLGVVSALIASHRRAQAAADLAALGGAHATQVGRDGCTAAAGLAIANGGRLQECRSVAGVVEVAVMVTGPHWLTLGADPVARARAGPELFS